MLLLMASSAGAATIAFDQPDLQAAATLRVTVPGVSDGGALPSNYSFSGRNLSPPMSWSEGPPQTRSFVVLMQDADALQAGSPATGSVGWLVYAIPATVLALPRGLRNVPSPASPLGSGQSRNNHDSLGYSGPKLAPGEPPHHYHLQVFALDRSVRLRGGAEPAAVLRAMSGHVVARGELVATYAAPSPQASHGHAAGSSGTPGPPSAGSAPTEPGR